MSLQIWLPLTNDINNYGVAGNYKFSIPSSGVIPSDDGILGKCYTFSAMSGNGIFSADNGFMNTYINHHSYSMCCWIKTTTKDTTPMNLSYGLGLLIDGNGKPYMRQYRSGSTVNTMGTTNCCDGVWHHITATYNATTNKSCVYVDGVLEKENAYSYNNDTYASSWANGIYIGRDPNNSTANSHYYYQGKMNDVRIYDHCLSAKEVQEIAKGLLLHYKMTSPDAEYDSGPVVLNSYVHSTFNTTANDGGWLHWGRTGSKGSFGQSTDLLNYQYRPTNSQYVHWVANAADATGEYLLYQSPEYPGGFRSLQCICKEENSLPIDESICFPLWNAHTSQSVPAEKWTSIEPLGRGFYLCKCEGIHQDGSNDLVGIHTKPGHKIYFSEVYLEDDRSVCSNILATSPNIITSLTKGGQTTVSNYETIVTSGTNADTYFTINLPDSVKYGEKYTISCQVSGLASGGYWTFPLGGQNNTSLAWRLVNGYNQMTFTINQFSWGSKRIFMDDNGASDRTKVMTIGKLSVVKHYTSDVATEFDCSGYQYNGTKNGPITADKTSPRFESALQFKPTSYIGIDPAPIRNGMTEFTVAWWMKINTLTDNACIYNGRSSVGGPIAIFSIGGTLRFDDGAQHNSLYTFPKSTWEHYAITWTTSKIKLYVNGVLVKEINSSTFTTTGTKATIGASSVDTTTGSGNALDGSLSDFRIYATALTDEAVKDLYHTAVAIDNGGTIHSFEFKE